MVSGPGLTRKAERTSGHPGGRTGGLRAVAAAPRTTEGHGGPDPIRWYPLRPPARSANELPQPRATPRSVRIPGQDEDSSLAHTTVVTMLPSGSTAGLTPALSGSSFVQKSMEFKMKLSTSAVMGSTRKKMGR